MPESKLSCPGVKAVPSGKWQVTCHAKDGRHIVDPYEYDSDEAAHQRADEYLEAGAASAGWRPLYLAKDGRSVVFDDLGPGAFDCIRDEARGGPAVMCILPEGSKTFLPVQIGPPGGPRVWGWDGNENLPTVQPSIWYKERWHGFFENGFFRSC